MAAHKGYIPKDRAVQHLNYLVANGATLSSIAIKLGLTPAALTFTRNKAKFIHERVEAALLAITVEDAVWHPEPYDDYRRDRGITMPTVPKWRSQRRVRALQRMGYPTKMISEAVGFEVRFILWNDSTHMAFDHHEKIVALYDEISHIPGPSNSARLRAWRLGYAPPAAWDDIDDEQCKPRGLLPAPPYRKHYVKWRKREKLEFPPEAEKNEYGV